MLAISTLDLVLAAVAGAALGVLAVGAFGVRLLLRRIEWFHDLIDELDVEVRDRRAVDREHRDDADPRR